MESEKLRPCPFCGGRASTYPWVVGSLETNVWQIICEKCDTKSREFYSHNLNAAVKRWNERVGDES